MGGSIRLESEYGVGTTMTVDLKLPKVPELLVDQAAATLASEEDIRRDDIWVLVVDDNKLNRDIITRLLIKSASRLAAIAAFDVDSFSSITQWASTSTASPADTRRSSTSRRRRTTSF